jgi:hypothetical protein
MANTCALSGETAWLDGTQKLASEPATLSALVQPITTWERASWPRLSGCVFAMEHDGVTWVDGELWHATWEGEESDLRRIDPGTGQVFESVEMPRGVGISGLESGGHDQFFCGGGKSGRVRAVRRPRRRATRGSVTESPVGSRSV